MQYGMHLYVVVEAQSPADAKAQQEKLREQLQNPMLLAILQGYGIRYAASDLAGEPYLIAPAAVALPQGRR